jgi:hypothetical protein
MPVLVLRPAPVRVHVAYVVGAIVCKLVPRSCLDRVLGPIRMVVPVVRVARVLAR